MFPEIVVEWQLITSIIELTCRVETVAESIKNSTCKVHSGVASAMHLTCQPNCSISLLYMISVCVTYFSTYKFCAYISTVKIEEYENTCCKNKILRYVLYFKYLKAVCMIFFFFILLNSQILSSKTRGSKVTSKNS